MPDGPPVPPLPQLIEDYARIASYVRPSRIVGVALKTNQLDEAAARAAADQVRAETGLPASDPVRWGAGELLDVVLAESGR
jgi:uncharacterized NAD-dependent epimerase/dehydratase family protein